MISEYFQFQLAYKILGFSHIHFKLYVIFNYNLNFNREIDEKRKKESYDETEAASVRITAAEVEDKWTSELAGFTPASRLTGTSVQLLKTSKKQGLHLAYEGYAGMVFNFSLMSSSWVGGWWLLTLPLPDLPNNKVEENFDPESNLHLLKKNSSQYFCLASLNFCVKHKNMFILVTV